LFDDFATPPILLIVQGISLAVVIGSAFALRSAAEEARRVARGHISTKIIAAKGASNGGSEAASQLEAILARIESLRDGAFAPWSSQPVVTAVLLPLVSYGGTLLVHVYALPGT
jgi:hypothetical protein